MKKIRLISVLITLLACVVMLSACNLGGYNFQLYISPDYSKATQIGDSSTTFDGCYNAGVNTFVVLSKQTDGRKTYGVYDVTEQKLIVNFGAYTDYDKTRGLDCGRFIAATLVGGAEKWGVLDLFENKVRIPFDKSAAEIANSWTGRSDDNVALEIIRGFDADGNVISGEACRIDLERRSKTQLEIELCVTEGETVLGLNDVPLIFGFSDLSQLPKSMSDYSYVQTSPSEITFYNGNGKNEGSFSTDVAPYTLTDSITIGKYIIRQKTRVLDALSKNYTYVDASGNKHEVITEIYNILSGSLREADFEYVIDGFNTFENDDETYITFTGRKIADEYLGSRYSYICEYDLDGVKRLLAESDSFISLRNYYILDLDNSILYDGKFNFVTDYSGFEINGISKRNLSFYNGRDSYVTDLEGVVQKRFVNTRVYLSWEGDYMTVSTNDSTGITTYASMNDRFVSGGTLFTVGSTNAVSNIDRSCYGLVAYVETIDGNSVVKVKKYDGTTLLNYTCNGTVSSLNVQRADESAIVTAIGQTAAAVSFGYAWKIYQ